MTRNKITRSALSVLLTAVMLLTGLSIGFVGLPTFTWGDPWNYSYGDSAPSGYSENGNNVYLDTPEAFAYFAAQVRGSVPGEGSPYNVGEYNSYEGKTVYLRTNVDFNGGSFSGIGFYLEGHGYKDGCNDKTQDPITRPFKGVFDGRNNSNSNYTISNFSVTSNQHRVGLFRTVSGATIRNLNLSGVLIDDTGNEGRNGFGALVGFTTGNLTVENVHVLSGTVYGCHYVGGLVGENGENSGGTLRFTNCSNAASVQADNDRAGGMVGHCMSAIVATNCSNSGSITATSSDGGGIAGWIEDDESSFTNCTNSGNVTAAACAGGIFGYFGSDSGDKKMTLTNNTNTGNITSTGSRAGGIAGHLETDHQEHDITGNTNHGTISAPDDAGGIVGRNKGSGTWSSNYNDGAVTSTGSDAGGIVGEIEDDRTTFYNCTNEGTIKSENARAGGLIGFFGDIDSVMTIRNCTNTGLIRASANKSEAQAGGLAGILLSDARHVIENNTNRGEVYAREDAGGIVARNEGAGEWRNNVNFGKVHCDNDNAGGIVGETEDDANDLYNCYNSGEIIARNTCGGIYAYGPNDTHTFTDCGNSGSVTSTTDYHAGGIFGFGNSGPITFTQCWNVGDVKAVKDCGGICGHVDYHTFFYRCWNGGNISKYNSTASDNSRGGLIGYTSYNGNNGNSIQMEDCYNWGSVTNGQYSGGLVGRVNNGNSDYLVTNSYNAGPVSGQTAGALIGSGGKFSPNYWYDSNVAMGTVQGTAKSDDDLIASSGPSANFCKNTWGVKIGSTTYYYPILNWYRNLFTFNSRFYDEPTETDTTIEKVYNASFTTPNPSREGYTANGNWYNTANANQTLARGASVTAGVTACMDTLVITQHKEDVRIIENSTTYNLNWTAHTYQIHFDGNGSNYGMMENLSMKYDVSKSLPAVGFFREYTVSYGGNGGIPARDSDTVSYPFAGWATSENGAKTYDDQVSVRNLTPVNGATITLYAKWNSASATLPDATRNGYTFAGWYSSASGGTRYGGAGDSYTPVANTAMYAHWTANTYTVVYNGNENTGGSTASSSHTYDVAKNLTTNGFERKHTVTFNGNGGTAASASKTATATFNGWATSADGAIVYDNSQSVTNLTATNGGTVNLFAKWTPGSVTLPTVTRDECDFLGWKGADDPTFLDAGTSITAETNLTFTAQWKPKDITVFAQNSGEMTIDSPAGAVTDASGQGFDESGGKITFSGLQTLQDVASGKFTVDGIGHEATVTVIPAAVIYFDDSDSIFTYTDKPDGDKGVWGAAPTVTGSAVTPEFDPDIFGNIDPAANTVYFGGSAEQVTVTSDHKLQSGGAIYDNCPTVKFTFTGTAFEVISAVDSGAATISYSVKKIKDADGASVTESATRSIVDTYMGYKLNADGEWETGAATTTKYRIPVIRKELSYGTYEITIAAFWNSYYVRSHPTADPIEDSQFNFIFDGVRVYDPAGSVDQTTAKSPIVFNAYSKAQQADWTETTIRDAIDATGGFYGLMADGEILTPANYSKYKSALPKNELWLEGEKTKDGTTTNGNVTILVNTNAPQVWLSMAGIEGAAGYKIAYLDEENARHEITGTVGYGTKYIEVPKSVDGFYTITNTGTSVLSLRNIRYIPGSTNGNSGTTARISLFMKAHAADDEFRILLPFTEEALVEHLDRLAAAPLYEPATEPTTEPTTVEQPTEPVVEPTEPAVEPTEPATEQPTEQQTAPAEPVTQPNSDGVICGYCGKSHPRTFLGSLIRLIHAVLYFFRTVFGLAK